MAYTISTTNDNRKKDGGQMQDFKHNLRDERAVREANNFDISQGRKPHIDVERMHLNKYIKTESLEQAYERIFSSAVDEYNSKQKRKDRHTSVKKEMEKIEASINNKNSQFLCYEMITQVGNEKNHPDVETCNKILEEFLEEWERKYPNLKIFQAVIHNDEATPHMHIDYIPVSYNNKRGLSVQNGLRRAYEEMGFTNQEKEAINKETGETITVFDREGGAKAQWIKDCNNMLEEICIRHGLEIEHPLRGTNTQRMQMNEYKEAMEENEKLKEENIALKKEKTKIQRENLSIENEIENKKSELNYYDKELEKIDKNLNDKNTELEEINNDLDDKKEELKATKNTIDKLEKTGDEIVERHSELKDEINILKNEKENFKSDIKNDLEKDINNIINDNVISAESAKELIDDVKTALINAYNKGYEAKKYDKNIDSNRDYVVDKEIKGLFRENSPLNKVNSIFNNVNNSMRYLAKEYTNNMRVKLKEKVEKRKQEKKVDKIINQINYEDFFDLSFDKDGNISEKSEQALEKIISSILYDKVDDKEWSELQNIYFNLDQENRDSLVKYIKDDSIKYLKDYHANDIQLKKEKYKNYVYKQSSNYCKAGNDLLSDYMNIQQQLLNEYEDD